MMEKQSVQNPTFDDFPSKLTKIVLEAANLLDEYREQLSEEFYFKMSLKLRKINLMQYIKDETD